jgi:glycerophosphoryl diester phosphodiesterase
MRFSFVILTIIGCFLSCTRELLPTNTIQLIGHGGEGFSNLSALYAPNSVGSMKRALDFYALDGIEVDVRFTADSTLIVFHDEFLEQKTQCKGAVSGVHSSDAIGCYYRKQFNNDYSQSVIGLDSFIVLLNTKWRTQPVSFQVHTMIEENKQLDDLAKLYARRVAAIKNKERIATESYNANFLFYLRRLGDYNCRLIASIDSTGVKDVFRFNLQGIVSRFDERNAILEKRLKDSGKHISIYGQKLNNDYTNWDYKYIDAVQVDNPIKALKFYKKR